MRGSVVYHSRWGNCRKVAESISKGLSNSGHDVVLQDVKTEGSLSEGVQFIVVGSPTRGGQMSKPIKQFIASHIGPGWKGKPFAAFGTGHRKWLDRGGQSKDAIQKALIGSGLVPLADPFQGVVEKMKGPLAEGTVEEAYGFGMSIGESLKNQSIDP